MATKKLQILGSFGNNIYAQPEEPVDAPENALWVDTDEDGATSGGTGDGYPPYTEADYGKVLTCTAEGVAWIAQEVLPNAEEATF